MTEAQPKAPCPITITLGGCNFNILNLEVTLSGYSTWLFSVREKRSAPFPCRGWQRRQHKGESLQNGLFSQRFFCCN